MDLSEVIESCSCNRPTPLSALGAFHLFLVQLFPNFSALTSDYYFDVNALV
jgi:hypothetical protein